MILSQGDCGDLGSFGSFQIGWSALASGLAC